MEFINVTLLQKQTRILKILSMKILPVVFGADWAACAFSGGFVSLELGGDPSFPLFDVEQYCTCVHVTDATLESRKLNQSLWTPPPLCQPIE